MTRYDTTVIKEVIERYAPDGGQDQPDQVAGLWIENGFEDPEEVRAFLEAGVTDPEAARAQVEERGARAAAEHGRDVVLGTTDSRERPALEHNDQQLPPDGDVTR